MTFPSRAGLSLTPTGNLLKNWDAGQSNSPGQATTNVPAGVAGSFAYPRLIQEVLREPGFYERVGAPCRDQAVNPADHGALAQAIKKYGASVKFATDVLAGGRVPVCVTTSRSGTAIAEWASGQQCRNLFDTVFDEVTPLLGATGWMFSWRHGESDASSGVTAAAYQAALIDLLTHVRSKLTSCYLLLHTLPSQLGGGALAANIATINTAMTNALASVGGPGQVLNTQSAANLGYADPHFLAAGYDSLGAQAAAIALANI